MGKVISPEQCRAGRALLGWTQQRLADEAGIARKTVVDFERRARTLHGGSRRAIAAALESGGVHFINDERGEAIVGAVTLGTHEPRPGRALNETGTAAWDADPNPRSPPSRI